MLEDKRGKYVRVHIVQKGDTLWKIAKQYTIGFDELKRLNAHLANPDYIVPGMEIYLPALPAKKEEVKEQPIQQQPAPAPSPKEQISPAPMPSMPSWQGDLYLQPQMPPQPQFMPMQMPQWQHTHVHFEPTIEQTMMPMPQQLPMPQMPPQQMPQMQPMYMPPMPPQYMPQMMPMPPQQMSIHQVPCQQMHHPMPQQLPMPQQMPMCSCGHGVHMDEQTMTSPIQREESSAMTRPCLDKEQRVQHYYDEIQQITHQPRPCCPHQMQPYPMQMMPMQPMHCLPPWHM